MADGGELTAQLGPEVRVRDRHQGFAALVRIEAGRLRAWCG
jgi:hypothetical protein